MKKFVITVCMLVSVVAFADMGNGLPSKFHGASMGKPVDVSPFIHFRGNCYLALRPEKPVTLAEVQTFIGELQIGAKLPTDTSVETSAFLVSLLPADASIFIANKGTESYKHWVSVTNRVNQWQKPAPMYTSVEKPKVAFKNGYQYPVSTNEAVSCIVLAISDDNITNVLAVIKDWDVSSAANASCVDLYPQYVAKFKAETDTGTATPVVVTRPKTEQEIRSQIAIEEQQKQQAEDRAKRENQEKYYRDRAAEAKAREAAGSGHKSIEDTFSGPGNNEKAKFSVRVLSSADGKHVPDAMDAYYKEMTDRLLKKK